jgi:uncharacterized membrane protein
MMRILDRIMLAILAIGLIVLYLLRECHLDIYYILAGVLVLLLALVAMLLQSKRRAHAKANKNANE